MSILFALWALLPTYRSARSHWPVDGTEERYGVKITDPDKTLLTLSITGNSLLMTLALAERQWGFFALAISILVGSIACYFWLLIYPSRRLRKYLAVRETVRQKRNML